DITVIVSSSITKSGPIISGDVPEMVIIHTDPGYSPNPGHEGTGTVTAVVCQSWRVIDVADFNRDGHLDYLLHNAGTRQSAVWYLNNNAYIGGAYAPTLPIGWTVAGVADFDGDGHPDYLLFHPDTGYTAIFYLSGPTLIGGAWGPTVPGAWRLVGVGDFNGDSKPDYVIYNARTHQTAHCHLNNNVRIGRYTDPR